MSQLHSIARNGQGWLKSGLGIRAAKIKCIPFGFRCMCECLYVFVVKKLDCLVVTSLLWGRPFSFTSSFCARSPERQLLRQQGLSQWGCIYKRRFHYEVFVKKMLHCPRVSISSALCLFLLLLQENMSVAEDEDEDEKVFCWGHAWFLINRWLL